MADWALVTVATGEVEKSTYFSMTASLAESVVSSTTPFSSSAAALMAASVVRSLELEPAAMFESLFASVVETLPVNTW